MLAARIRAWSHGIELMNPPVPPPATTPSRARGSAGASSGRTGWVRFLFGIGRRADLGVQHQGNLVLTRTIQVTVFRIDGRHALGVFARLGKRDQLDELVGRVLLVLLAPARHHA